MHDETRSSHGKAGKDKRKWKTLGGILKKKFKSKRRERSATMPSRTKASSTLSEDGDTINSGILRRNRGSNRYYQGGIMRGPQQHPDRQKTPDRQSVYILSAQKGVRYIQGDLQLRIAFETV